MDLSPAAAYKAWLDCLATTAASAGGIPAHVTAGDGEITAPCILVHALPEGQRELAVGCGIYRSTADIEIVFSADDTTAEDAAALANTIFLAMAAIGDDDYAAAGLTRSAHWLEAPDFAVHKGHRHYKQTAAAVYCQA